MANCIQTRARLATEPNTTNSKSRASGTRMAFESSNYRELMTVLVAVKSLKSVIRNKTIQLLSDNISTVCYLNHLGGPSPRLTSLANAIWAECFLSNTTLVCRHLAGRLNIEADQLSRRVNKFEWRLHPRLFGLIDSLWGPHTCDQFASFVTTHLPYYNSRYLDPMSSGVDALAQQDWGQQNNFVNPPFCLPIAIKTQKPEMVMKVGRWKTQ